MRRRGRGMKSGRKKEEEVDGDLEEGLGRAHEEEFLKLDDNASDSDSGEEKDNPVLGLQESENEEDDDDCRSDQELTGVEAKLLNTAKIMKRKVGLQEEEDEEEERTARGKSTRVYYGGDNVDFEEAVQRKEKKADGSRKKSSVSKENFTMDVEKVKRDLDALTKEEKMNVVMSQGGRMFYDLNIPVDGVGDLARREVVAMAMQLGYSGVAANHVVSGVMGDTDRCRVRPLELQMILAAAPRVVESARFHHKVLGVPPGQPFRQFSRITVVVETPTQANAVNSANPVLKSYDLVAVRPTNQKMFNLTCSQLEVDLISLDVTQRLPFRLKPAMVKAAVETILLIRIVQLGREDLSKLRARSYAGIHALAARRGIYFEICYGRALLDPKARRELFINSTILQEGASSRNIVVCSGARRATEMRGPNDVANMSTLFGFSLELAKNCVSRTCKSLLLHGVARKTYKAAIHVERVSLQSKPTAEAFNVPMDWDPLSVGGASVDFIPLTEIPNKRVSSKKSTSFVEQVKFASSEADGGDKATVQSVNILAAVDTVNPRRDTSGSDMVTSKGITTVIATRTTGNQIRRGKPFLADNTEEAQGKNKAQRRKRKR